METRLLHRQSIHYRPPFPEVRLTETLEIPWFSAIAMDNAEPLRGQLTLLRVNSIADALAGVATDSWADFRLERRNDLTKTIAVRLQHRDSEWNKCASAFREYFDREASALLRGALERHGLPQHILSVIAWDIICYWQEINYLDVARPGFFHGLFEVYRAGHLPCGWKGIDIESASDAVVLYR
jgi:hypothetical protein